MEKNILLVDNNEYSLAKIEEYLKIFGFQVNSTKNGQYGLSTLRSQRPDLILISDTITDIDIEAFLERKKRMLGEEDAPVIVFIGTMKIIDVKRLIKAGADDKLVRPVVLEKLKNKVFQYLNLTPPSSNKHLLTEVFIREGIIIVEIRGSLVNEEIVALKYRILDTARTDQTLKKRFYIIIYSLEEENISHILLAKLFDFVFHFPQLPPTNVKILTSDQRIIELLKKSKVASDFEIVDNYIEGLNKLKSLYLENQEGEVLVEFLKPNVALYKNVYDKKGALIKEEGKSFTAEELQNLLQRGVRKLYYTRKAKVDADRQILENEDVDVVMDSIMVTGIMIPEELMDLGAVKESKKRFSVNILIVNSNEQERNSIYDFFVKKGFSTIGCKSSKEALETVKSNAFDYVIVDLELEIGSGLNLVRGLKSNPNTKNAHYILTSKMVKKESVEQAMKLGVQGFLKSPFNPEKLSQIIK